MNRTGSNNYHAITSIVVVLHMLVQCTVVNGVQSVLRSSKVVAKATVAKGEVVEVIFEGFSFLFINQLPMELALLRRMQP